MGLECTEMMYEQTNPLRSPARESHGHQKGFTNYFGNFGMLNFNGSPVNAFKNATRSVFSSAVKFKGFTSGLRLGLLPPP